MKLELIVLEAVLKCAIYVLRITILIGFFYNILN